MGVLFTNNKSLLLEKWFSSSAPANLAEYRSKTNGMSVKDISKITGVPRRLIYAEIKRIKDKNKF